MEKRPILIIDDDHKVCELVTSVLTGAGFDVLAASDGLRGIETARAAQPTVILLDMMMPGLDGIDTCQRLKQDPVLEDIPVVGITASEDLTYTAKAFRTGAEFFLPKPFEVEGLLHVVSLAEEAVRRQTRLVRRHQRRSRFPVEIPVRCLVTEKPSATRDVTGHTGDVSIGGLLLLLPEKLTSGTVFRLRLRLPGGVIPAEAMVVWQDPQPVVQDRFRHGIKLLRFPEDCDLVLYRRFLSEVAAGHASGTQS